MSLFVLLPESFAVILGSKEEKSILYILPLSYDDFKIDRYLEGIVNIFGPFFTTKRPVTFPHLS